MREMKKVYQREREIEKNYKKRDTLRRYTRQIERI